MRDLMPLPEQFCGQLAHTFARPAQRRFWITSSHWFHQAFQILAQTGIFAHGGFASTTPAANPSLTAWFSLLQFLDAVTDDRRDNPVARETAEIPPHPNAIASLAASSRRVRSLSSPDTRSKRCLIASSSFIPHSLSPASSLCKGYSLTIPKYSRSEMRSEFVFQLLNRVGPLEGFGGLIVANDEIENRLL